MIRVGIRLVMIVPITVRMPVRIFGIVGVSMVVAVGSASADAFDVMMMTFLRQPDFIFEAQHLFAVLAQLAVHIIFASSDFVDSFHESFDHHGMVV